MMLKRLRQTETGLITALAFILGGAIGNLIDRIIYGEVVDFLDVYWSDYHWPAFNLADSFITIGVGITVYYLATVKAMIRSPQSSFAACADACCSSICKFLSDDL